MPIKLNGSTSGSVTVQAPAIAGTNTLTLPATTGNIISSADTGTVTQTMLGTNVAGNGPAFSAYLATNQTVTNATFTKITCGTKEFDTNSNYDNATNYRFTPTIAGYYQISGALNAVTSAGVLQIVTIYKNGSEFKRGNANVPTTSGGNSTVSALIYMNGSTDYVELYGYVNNGTAFGGGQSLTYFQGFLARSA